jgi:hypothetical protein
MGFSVGATVGDVVGLSVMRTRMGFSVGFAVTGASVGVSETGTRVGASVIGSGWALLLLGLGVDGDEGTGVLGAIGPVVVGGPEHSNDG